MDSLANLPVEHVAEVISAHLHTRLEKAVRDALTNEVSPIIRELAQKYAREIAQECLVSAGHNIATDRLEIMVQIKGE